jgi:hypothetical protein
MLWSDEVKQEFLKPKLVGERFQGHAVPLEVLKDFAALQEMLVETAKWKFRQEHPSRERVQRNFAKDIELQLVGIEDGSAKLMIVLSFLSLFPPQNVKYFEAAKVEIVNAIAQSAEGKSPQMPPSLLSYFDRFGRSLRIGESIEFPNGEHPAALTPEVRKQLIHAARVEVWTEELALRAKIFEADVLHNSFEFELSDGTRAKAPLDEKYRDAVIDATRGYHNGVFILIQGVAQRDRSDRLKGFESIEHVTPLDPLDVTLRLEQISALKNGWLDGKGLAPSKDKLEWLADAFDTNFDSDLPLPYLYPTAEGGVQAEWGLNDWAVTLEINLENEQGEYQALNLKNQTCTDRVIALAERDGWTQLNQALKQLESPQAEASQSEA